MRQTRLIMGMPITIWVVDAHKALQRIIDETYALLSEIDRTYSTYKPDSQISRVNSNELTITEADGEVQEVLETCITFRDQTLGYFDIRYSSGRIDPSGYVKGWAIQRAGEHLRSYGLSNFCVDAGGDIMFSGRGENTAPGWQTAIASPFDDTKVVKTLRLEDKAIATSGTAIRGEHIFDPHSGKAVNELASVSVVGPDIVACDVLATAIFAMGRQYTSLLSRILPDDYDVFVVDSEAGATFTPGFKRYTS